MKIKYMEIMPVEMPKEDPGGRFVLGGEPVNRGFIVKLINDDGIQGFALNLLRYPCPT